MLRNKIRYTIVCLTNLVIFSFVSPSMADEVKSIFYISKSENSNQVHYGIKLNQNCLPANNKPVYPYWLMPGGKTENLNPITEPPAYGIASQTVSKDKIDIVLNSFKSRGIEKPITLIASASKSSGKCQVKAYTKINKVQKEFSHARVDITDIKKSPFNGMTVGGRVVKFTIFSSDGTSEIFPCSSNCKFGI
jgi:Domain of unknown function (DUF4833)